MVSGRNNADLDALSFQSAGAVAAVLEDALLEEGTELADVVFGEVEVAVCVGSERRAGGRQHHPEQVPQITLQNRRQNKSASASTATQPESSLNQGRSALPPGDFGAPQPSARLCCRKVSLEGTREPPAAKETSGTSVQTCCLDVCTRH